MEVEAALFHKDTAHYHVRMWRLVLSRSRDKVATVWYINAETGVNTIRLPHQDLRSFQQHSSQLPS